jgi:hypothetical protein
LVRRFAKANRLAITGSTPVAGSCRDLIKKKHNIPSEAMRPCKQPARDGQSG